MAATPPRQPRYIQLLPPERPTAPPPAPQPDNQVPAAAGDYWMPAPLIRRVLDKIAAKDTRAFGDRVAEESRVITLLTEQLRLMEGFARQIGRAATLPMMAAAAQIEAYAEQEEIIDKVNYDQRMRQIEREKELMRAERELADLKRGPLPALPAPPKEKRRKSRGERIKEVKDDCEATIATLRNGVKDEDLDADTLDLIDQCRYNAKRRINDILQED